MSLTLTLLSGVTIALAAMALIRPSTLFTYPVAAGLLMLAFIMPQAWQIESSGEAIEFDPPFAWGYMLLCVLALVAGFMTTARQGRISLARPKGSELFFATYYLDRLYRGCILLVVIGSVSWVLMAREAAALESNAQWTGVITLYAQLTSLLLFGTTLSWLMYLYTGDKRTLVLSAIGLSFAVPTVLYAARRELAFSLITSFLLGLFFVRGKSVGRVFLIPMILVGALYINQAGAIRSYMQAKDTSVIGALASDDVVDLSNGVHTSEVSFAVSDIALSQWSGEYALFVPHWNSMVQLYFPAFLFGRDNKDSLRIDQDSYVSDRSAAANGATHTGFGETFVEFHYFGAISFFIIAAILGVFWKNAKRGDIGSQFLYTVLLTEGMMSITEGTTRFVGKVPFLFAVMGLLFWYARRPKSASNSNPLKENRQSLV